MQKIKKNKGFTLVELAIVIAVIAILIAVLVPTFISLINKANESSDSQLVKNLNTTLSVNEATDGEAATMSDALAVAAENGYNVDKLTPSSSGDIVWDQVSNRFLLIGEDGSIVYKDSSTSDSVTSTKYQLWYIASSSDDVEYSVYYTSDYSGTVTSTVTNKGIDVSALSETVNITYSSSDSTSQSVIINGNGGLLTVNDTEQKDDIDVYNVSSTIDGQSVADSSLHLHGEVTGNIYMTKGHIEVEDSAVLGVPYVIALSENVSVSSATVAVKVVAGSSDVDVSKITVKGNVDNSDTTTVFSPETLNQFAGGLGTEECPYQIANETQFKKISSGSKPYYQGIGYVVEYTYYKLIDNITLTEDTAGYYKDNSGIESYYHVSTKLVQYLKLDGDGYTVSLADDVEDNYNSVFYQLGMYVVIKNITINLEGTSGQQIVRYGSAGSSVASAIHFENVTTEGDLNVTGNDGAFVSYGKGYIYFTDCVNKVNLTGTGTETDYNAAFVGYSYYSGSSNTNFYATFENCTNEGNIVCGKAAMFVGNIPATNAKLYLTVTNCDNTGTIRSTYVDSGYTPYYYIGMNDSLVQQLTVDGTQYTYNDSNLPAIANTYNGPLNDVMTISLNKDGYYEVTKSNQANIATYQISVGLYTRILNSSGSDIGTNRYFITITVNASELDSGTYVSAFENLQFIDLGTYLDSANKNEFDATSSDVVAIGDGYKVYVENEWYYLINDSNCYLSNDTGKASISFVTSSVYSSSGNLLSSTSA